MLLLIVFLLASEFHREATAPSRSVRGRIQGDSQTPSRRRRLAKPQTDGRWTLSMLQIVGMSAMGQCRAMVFKQRRCQALAEWRNRFSARGLREKWSHEFCARHCKLPENDCNDP